MNVTWKVLHTIPTVALEEKLNQLAMEDYDVYRLEFIELGSNETGTIPMPQGSAPVHVNVTPPGYTPQQQVPFQNPSSGYTTSGAMSKTRTRTGFWIIVACRVET